MCTIAGTSRASRYTYVDGRLIWIAEANPCRYRPSQSLAKIVAAFRRRCALPYFGESDALVYVGGVRNVYAPDPDTCLWDSSGAIVELRRGKVHLQFERARAFLNRRRRRPIAAAWKTFDSFLERLGLPH